MHFFILPLLSLGNENNIACQRPILNPFDQIMMSFLENEPPLVCDKEEDWVVVKGNIARITDKALKKYGDIQCKFMGIYEMSKITYQLLSITSNCHMFQMF